MQKLAKSALLKTAANIKLAVFDVDGVLTDGRLILGESGNEYKCFHIRDGQGLVMLLESGCEVAVITARGSKIVAQRMAELGINYVYQNEKNKAAKLLQLIKMLKLETQQVAYVGDDLVDLSSMQKIGLPIAVADAHPVIKDNALWVTAQRGGQGAAREVCELIMTAQNKLEAIIATYRR